jgi:hypothetical protein
VERSKLLVNLELLLYLEASYRKSATPISLEHYEKSFPKSAFLFQLNL